MTEFKDYAKKYSNVRMEREDGILEITFHTDGGSLVWGGGPHAQFGPAFYDIGRDKENKIVIMTGTGDSFIEEISPETLSERLPKSKITPTVWDHIYSDAKRLIMNLFDIEVPVIAAVNGPVNIHAELAILSDIVLASETRRLPGRSALPERACSRRRSACDLALSARKKSRPLFSSDRRAALGAGSASAGGRGGSVAEGKTSAPRP